MIAEALAAIAKALGVADKVAAMIQASQQKAAGINEERAATGAQAAKVNENVAKAAVETTDAVALDRLIDGKG